MLIACLGDSITEGSPYWDSRRGTGDPEGQWEHWAQLAHPTLDFANHGIGGQRTDEIALRFDEAVAGADVLILQGGINDIAAGRPIEQAFANLTGLLDRAAALALPVALCDVLPWNRAQPEQTEAIEQLNERIHALPVPLLPFYATLDDPASPGRMKAEWTNADGNHPSVEGYRRLGELAFRLP